MNTLKKVLSAALVATLALAVVGCGGSSQPDQGSAEPGIATQELSGASGAGFVATGNVSDTVTAQVTIAEGEAIVVMGQIEAGQVDVSITKDGEELSTDILYEGSGYSEMGMEPGDYEVQFTVADATGSFYALAFPAGQVDVTTMDTDEIIELVLGEVA